MTNSISLGGGHCCVCSQVCHHVGGPWLCAQHDPSRQWQAPPVVVIAPTGIPEKMIRPCPASTLGVLGFPAPTRLPCGLVEGHDGPHRYTIEWSEPA